MKQTKKTKTTTDQTMTMQTITPTAETVQPNQSSEEIKFDQVIEQTKADINQHEESKNKKRGRPSGGKNNKINVQPVQMQVINPSQYKEMLTAVLGFSGMYLSKVTQWDGFNLSKEEIDLLATQGSDIAVEFMPAVQSKYVKLGAFTLSFAMIYGVRYMEFQKIHEERTKKLVKKDLTPQNETNEIQTNG